MYIKNDHYSGYDNHGNQYTTRGLFLILVTPKDQYSNKDNMRAIVRKVALTQFGHWMMGYARIKGERITLSGSYGGDGLPVSVSDNIYNASIPLPNYLYDAWANGGGWNSAGSESNLMRKWALENLDKLYNVKK